MSLIKLTKKEIIAETKKLHNAAYEAIAATKEKTAQFEILQNSTVKLNTGLDRQKKEIVALTSKLQASLAELDKKSTEFSDEANSKLAAVDQKVLTITAGATKKVSDFIDTEIKPKVSETIDSATETKNETVILKEEVVTLVNAIHGIHNGASEKHRVVTEKHDTIAKLLITAEQNSFDIFGDEDGMCTTGPSIKMRSKSACEDAEKALVDGEDVRKQAESLLSKMTDASLHTAFSSAARRYMVGSWIILSIQILVLGIAAALAYRAITLDLPNLLKNMLPTVPLGFLVYFLNRAYTVEKKLAEEYQHKSSLTKTLAGYRALYKLSHEDKEYMELFTHIKEGITRNPSKEINPLLFRRLPIDTLTDTAEKAIGTVQKTAEKAVNTASVSVAKSADAIKTVANATEAVVDKVPD